MRFGEAHFFALGFVLSMVVVLIPFHFIKRQQFNERRQVKYRKHDIDYDDGKLSDDDLLSHKLYNESLSEKLYNEVKILCMVMTHPKNHKTKAIHVQNTWGRRCNKLLFISSEVDLQLDTVVLPFEESRGILWNKTRESFKYLYEHHLAEYDYFMKADDDNYIIVENVRFMLAHYHPTTALYFGHRYAVRGVDEGYMAGGGYILSKKALTKFVERLMPDTKVCHTGGGAEDMEMGRCLAHSALFVDSRDELHQKRFFPVGVDEHMIPKTDPKYWYIMNQYYHVAQGNTSCCSETSAGFHYVDPKEMYLLDYLIYHVHPFGVDDHTNETLPEKFSLEHIIAMSDQHSESPNFKVHKNNHQMDPEEIF